jgi:protein tyrosine phosphatase (PTP) superfamily phosphohydrolase (DUF442 family)
MLAVLTIYYLFLFLANDNFREVVGQKVYRSAQPSPEQLKKWTQLYKIRTVINLRGNAGKATDDLQEAADKLGVAVISIQFSAYELPPADSLTKLINTIEKSKLPILIHCRDGIDRTGTASAIAAMAIGNIDYDIAKWQAYVAPGPWKRKKLNNPDYEYSYVHISDILKLYERYCRKNNIKTNGWQQFKKWAVQSAVCRN